MHQVKVAVIDSGISQHSRAYNSIKQQYCLKKVKDDFEIIENITEDTDGHGTAISDIIFQQNPDIELLFFKLCQETDVECEQLCLILEYILEHVDVDIINISAGVTYIDYYQRLETVCNALREKGVILLSAFDNNGAISYPAALDSVLGVDAIEDVNLKKKDIIWVQNSCVNFVLPLKFYRTVWNDGTKTIMKGTSFACAELTGRIAAILFDSQGNRRSFKEIVDEITVYESIFPPIEEIKGPSFSISKAIMFPVNKEAHAVLRYQNMLSFKLVGVYDERVTGNIGTELFGKRVESYSDIDWDGDFDTVILSCVSRLASLTKKDYVKEIVEQARIHNKNIYTFEKIDSDYENIFFPEVKSAHVPHGNMQKLRKVAMPLVGVFGTSSKQGKYTLQLALKNKLEEKGYDTGFLATEPSGYLFGADSVYHFGYESNVELKQHENVELLNELVWKMDKAGHDIAITGCQSGILPYDYSNIHTFLLEQQNFLFGTRPDLYILCINPHDKLSYVQRTIQYLNAIDEGKVAACALYPIKTVFTASGVQMKKEILQEEEVQECKRFFTENCGLPVYEIGNEKDIKILCEFIIQTFNGEE